MNRTIRKVALAFALSSLLQPAYGAYSGFKPAVAHENSVTYLPEGGVVFQLSCGDTLENGKSRSWLSENPVRTVLGGLGMRYEFGVVVPDGWPLDQAVDALIVQWKNGDGGPYMSIHINRDQLVFHVGEDKFSVPVIPNKIQDIVVETVFDKVAGSVRWVVDGNEVFSLPDVPTMNPNEVTPGFSFGIYRPQWDNTTPATCIPGEANSRLVYFPYVQYGPQ